MSEYLNECLAWSFVGLTLGYIIGRTEVTIRRHWRNSHD